MLVSGVRSSWETFETKSDFTASSARSWSTTRVSTARALSFSSAILLIAVATWTTSRGPSTGARAACSPPPSRWAVSSSARSGPVTRRPTDRLSSTIRAAAASSTAASATTSVRVVVSGLVVGPTREPQQLTAHGGVRRPYVGEELLAACEQVAVEALRTGRLGQSLLDVGGVPVVDRATEVGDEQADLRIEVVGQRGEPGQVTTEQTHRRQVLGETLPRAGDAPRPEVGLGVGEVLERGGVRVRRGLDVQRQEVDRVMRPERRDDARDADGEQDEEVRDSQEEEVPSNRCCARPHVRMPRSSSA